MQGVMMEAIILGVIMHSVNMLHVIPHIVIYSVECHSTELSFW